MLQQLRTYCQDRVSEFEAIAPQRKALLESMATYIREKRNTGAVVRLVYICTHNSRRSHFGQIWGAVAADFYGIAPVETYSGGTEATAFHPNAIRALAATGFRIEQLEQSVNPQYDVYYSDTQSTRCYSKVYDDAGNPSAGFAAVMTCSDAEENCPFVPGTEFRLGLTYDDPKAADGTPEEATTYLERCRQIAREALYLFAHV